MSYARIYAELKDIARQGGSPATYEYIANVAAMELRREVDRIELARLLGEISTCEHEDGRPMLSVLVVRKDDQMPGEGFFTLARDLGRLTTQTHEDFVREEREAVYRQWQGPQRPRSREGAGGTPAPDARGPSQAPSVDKARPRTETPRVLSILIDACSHLVSDFDDFWLVAALSDWSYEEGIRAKGYRTYLESWTGAAALPDDLMACLKKGINGNLVDVLRQNPAVLEAEPSPNRGPDIVITATDGGGRVQVKLVYDETLSKYFTEIAADRGKQCDYQVVFFTSLPNFNYVSGKWYRAQTRKARSSEMNVVGIPLQLAKVVEKLGCRPNWPAGEAFVHSLPCGTAIVTEQLIRNRYAQVFAPKTAWTFAAGTHLRDAKVGVAIWDWCGAPGVRSA